MPWLSQESYPLPEEDLVSFAFGNTEYDNDKPVRRVILGRQNRIVNVCRSTMMQKMSREVYPAVKA